MEAKRLPGKLAIITGGASGIGAATARRFVDEGAKVLIADVNIEKAGALAEALGDYAASAKLDVRQPEDWRTVMEIASEIGPVTTLVNSAGIQIPGTIESADLGAFRLTMGVNLEGVFLGCKFGVEALKGSNGGSIINVASTMGVRANHLMAAYCASKGGVRMLTRSVALHCADQGYDIRVNAVVPGTIHTEMVEDFATAAEQAGQDRDAVIERLKAVQPMGRMGTAEEVANAIVYLASDESAFTTGADLPVDGGFLA